MIVASSKRIDNIKDLQHVNHHGCGDYHDRRTDHGYNDTEKDCELAGSIGARGLQDICWYSFERGGENHHTEAGPHPDIDGNQGQVIAWRINQPALGLIAKPGHDTIEQANLWLARRL